MDPITLIVTALVLGISTGLKPTAEQAVKDAYAGLKKLIQDRYNAKAGLEALENKPDSEAKKESLKEDLTDAGADQDPEVLEKAETVLQAVQEHAPQAAAAIGVDLEKVKAAFLKIQHVRATGTGVKVMDGEFTGGIEIGTVDAGGGAESPNP